MLSLFFLFGAAVFSPDEYTYSGTAALNSTELSSSEIDTGGLFNTGVSFSRFAAFIGLGIGLPATTPTWFIVMFSFWQIMFNTLIVGWVISSIWNG